MKKILANPTVRLGLRALLAGVGVLVAQIQASDHVDGAVLRAAIVAAALASLEAFTPLNALVGAFKKT